MHRANQQNNSFLRYGHPSRTLGALGGKFDRGLRELKPQQPDGGATAGSSAGGVTSAGWSDHPQVE